MCASPKQSFDPHELRAAHDAFDFAWATIGSFPQDLDEQAARALIARRIMRDAVENGERNPVRLKLYALRGFRP